MPNVYYRIGGEKETPATIKAGDTIEWEVKPKRSGASNSAVADKLIVSIYDDSEQWVKPFIDAGYPVICWDKKKEGDILEGFTRLQIMIEESGLKPWGWLFAPPCTAMAGSGARWWSDKDKPNPELEPFDSETDLAISLVQICLHLVDIYKPAGFWVMENPVGRIETLVPELKPFRKMSFNPCDFGEPYTKKTILWGQFNSDLKKTPVEPTEGSKMWKKYGGKSDKTKTARSATPNGFAKAFFEANKFTLDLVAISEGNASAPLKVEAAAALMEAPVLKLSEVFRTRQKIEVPELEPYPGGKGGHGVYQRIINQVPAGTTRFMEVFAGGASVSRWIRPAQEMILNEMDPVIHEIWERNLPKGWRLYNEDALELLVRCLKYGRETFIFLDPPYLPDTVSAQYDIYRCMLTREQHKKLLEIINELHCNIAITCYDNDLYREMLKGPKWRKITYITTTRGASREETMYMNYPEPKELHDYGFFGENNKQREYTHNMIRRTIKRFDGMAPHRRYAILSALTQKYQL